MTLFDILWIAVALAMDCLTISIVSAILLRGFVWPVALRMSVLFGVFQAGMTVLGWFCSSRFAAYIEAYDHWVAFALLAMIGGNMIRESFSDDDHHLFNPARLRTQLLLAVATSIDALAVGISMAFIGYATLLSMVPTVCIIGLVSLVFGLLGHALGARYGSQVARRLRPELLGGVILILIGMKILVSHLSLS